MIRLEMKNYNMILKKKQQKYQRNHPEKHEYKMNININMNMNILQAEKYYFLNKDK